MLGATASVSHRDAPRGFGALVATDLTDEADVEAAVVVSFRKRATTNERGFGLTPTLPAVTIFPSDRSTRPGALLPVPKPWNATPAPPKLVSKLPAGL
jgi:hypothetical protein